MSFVGRTCLQLVSDVLKTKCHTQLFRLTNHLKLSHRFYGHAYEGDGKTYMTILNEERDRLMIDSFSIVGFVLNNGLTALGPIAIFPNGVLSWNVNSVLDINEDSLILFRLMDPRPDILVLGTGDDGGDFRVTHKNITDLTRRMNMQVEVLPTESACATFNFLNTEKRFVAAALIPPRILKSTDVSYDYERAMVIQD